MKMADVVGLDWNFVGLTGGPGGGWGGSRSGIGYVLLSLHSR